MKKNFKGIADRLPDVYTRCVSGTGVYDVKVNHERRLRKAYESMGVDGINAYLESIHKLQKERNDKAVQDIQHQGVQEANVDADRDSDRG
jgi:hypothetical protein